MRAIAGSQLRPPARCPGCGVLALSAEPNCATCGIWLAGPQAAELRRIDDELRQLAAVRTTLIKRRQVLLAELYELRQRTGEAVTAGPGSAAQPDPAVPWVAPAAGPAGPAAHPASLWSAVPASPDSHGRPELSGRAAARLLLAAGAVLVVIAATVFTVANWSSVGPFGRCAILLAVTALILAAPWPLMRRNLTATAESAAAIGLALTVADAYLAWQVFPAWHAGGLAVAAACAALTALWAGYGAVSRLSGPGLAAIGLAQIPGPAAAAGLAHLLGGPAYPLPEPVALALVLTGGAGFLLAGWLGRLGRQALMQASSFAAVMAWTTGFLLALAGVADLRPGMGKALLICALGAAAVTGIVAMPRSPAPMMPHGPIAVVCGAALAIGLAIPVSAVLPSGWGLAAVAAAGIVVASAAVGVAGSTSRVVAVALGDPALGDPVPEDPAAVAGVSGEHSTGLMLPAARLRFAAAGSAAVLGVAGLLALPGALVDLFPARQVFPAWTGTPGTGPGAAGAAVPGAHAATVVLALAALACWLVPVTRRELNRSGALAIAALAAGTLPAATRLSGWPALAVLTAAAVLLLGAGAVRRDRNSGLVAPGEAAGDARLRAGVATVSGMLLAVNAAVWSLTGAGSTIAELAVLAAVFLLAAACDRNALSVICCTAGAVASVAGLACAVPLAAGWPARYAAFAVLAVAVAAIGVATRLRRARPVPALVLDLGAGPVVLLAAVMAARHAGTFAALTAAAALLASTTAWLRAGSRRTVALAGAGCAILAAVTVQRQSLTSALLVPYHLVTQSWHGSALAYAPGARAPGLPAAVAVLAACAAAACSAVGAWRGSGRGSLDAVAVALPLIAAPAGLAGGLGYGLTVGLLLALAIILTAWAALSDSLAPAGGALVAAALALAWALAAPLPTLVVLGCLAAGYPLCAWRARNGGVRIAATCLSVVSAAALAECLVLAAGRPGWQAGLAGIGAGAGAQIAAALGRTWRRDIGLRDIGPRDIGRHGAWRLDRIAGQAAPAAEITGWLTVAWGAMQCLGRPGPASLALAICGMLCIGVAGRPDRRLALWAGLALLEVAWCVWLASVRVGAPEPYTLPAAAVMIAAGWRASRHWPQARSWLTYGPGLALALAPALLVTWRSVGPHGSGWTRPLLLGLVSAAVTLAGARTRLRAPMLIGATVVVLDAGHELAPAIVRLTGLLPGWVPIAVTGAVLLWAGATYEARLRNLRTLRRSLAAMS